MEYVVNLVQTYNKNHIDSQISKSDGMVKWVEHLSPIVGDRGIRTLHVQTNYLNVDTWCYLVWHLTLPGQGKEQWNEEDQSFMTEIYPA